MSRHLITRLSWALLALALVLAGLQAYMLLQAPETSPLARAKENAPQASPAPTAAALTTTTPHPSAELPEQSIATAQKAKAAKTAKTAKATDATDATDATEATEATDTVAPCPVPFVGTAAGRTESETGFIDKGASGAPVDGSASADTPRGTGSDADTNNTQAAVPNAQRSDSAQPSPESTALQEPALGADNAAGRSRRTRAGAAKLASERVHPSEPTASEAPAEQAAPAPPAAAPAPPAAPSASSALRRTAMGAQSLAADFELYREQLEGIDASLPSRDGSSQLRFNESRAVCTLHWQSEGGRIRELSTDLEAADEGVRLRLVVHLLNQEVCRGAEVLDLGLYLIRLPEAGQQAAPRHEQIFLRLDASQPKPLQAE